MTDYAHSSEVYADGLAIPEYDIREDRQTFRFRDKSYEAARGSLELVPGSCAGTPLMFARADQLRG